LFSRICGPTEVVPLLQNQALRSLLSLVIVWVICGPTEVVPLLQNQALRSLLSLVIVWVICGPTEVVPFYKARLCRVSPGTAIAHYPQWASSAPLAASATSQ
jgi:hypothetical protein